MYQILPFRVLVLMAVWLAISTAMLLGRGESLPALLYHAILGSDLVLLLMTWKPVFIRIWRLLRLNAWFPDLNGEYDVEIHHNWPIQERLLAAAKGGPRFDPFERGAALPEFGTAHLWAVIDAGFYTVNIRMMADDPSRPGSVIENSRTLVTALKRRCDGQPHRLIYVYEQKNRPDRHEITDESVFRGAAIIGLESSQENEFTGEYWTNRAWRFGVSTAGVITFRRRDHAAATKQ
jgi:hypothetical protein